MTIRKEIDIYIVGYKRFLNKFKAEEYNKKTEGKYFRTQISWLLYLNRM